MTKNIGNQERIIRTVAGLSFLYLAVSRRKLLTLAGIGLLVTAALEYCPVNEAAGLNTAESENTGLESEDDEVPSLVAAPQKTSAKSGSMATASESAR